MRVAKITPFILSALLIISSHLIGQTGPGGVGNSASNPLWLRADVLNLASGDVVSSWADTSGNDNDFVQLVSGLEPTFQTQNGIKVVRFDGEDDFLEENASFAGYTARTAFVVYRVDANLQENTDLGQLWGHYQGGTQVAVDARGGNLQGYSFDGNSSDRAGYGRNGADIAGNYRDDNSDPWVYDNFEVVAVEFDSDRTMTSHLIGNLVNPAGLYYGGDIAEIVVYSSQLNGAQKIIVDNYLANKYGITLTQNDYFAHKDTYSNEIAGIGQVTGASHTSAFSGSILKIENPSDLANDEFMIFGHEGSVVDSWTTTNTPFSGSNISRIAREWRLDETGDVGTIDLTIDTSLFDARPAGYTKFVVMLDDDGDFSDADRIYELVSGGGDEFFSISGLEVNDNDYLTVAAVKPVVQFANIKSSGFEDEVCSIEISSNFILQSDVTVQITTADGTALSGGDYTGVTNQDVIISAGSISADASITILDDAISPEDDENFTVTLTSVEAEIGAQNVHTYTIHDNDNARKIYFADINPSVNENAGTLDVTLEVSSANATTTVDFEVIGGTATSGDDYTLADGTVTFDAGTTKDFTITLNNDAIPEPTETLIIRLHNPIEGNLSKVVGQPIVDTISITDDADENRKVSFLTDSISKKENVVDYNLTISLSGITGYDVEVDYTVTGNGILGADHSLADGTITIPAGDTEYELALPIINDDEEELMDTIIVTLSNPLNADLGTKTVFKYYILNDDFGYIGAGGVGSTVAIKQWLRADTLITKDGSNRISDWGDFSGNGFGVSQSVDNHKPWLVEDVINGQPAVHFHNTGHNGTGKFLEWEDLVNGYQAQEVFAVVLTSLDSIRTSNLGQIWGSYGDGFHVALEARSSRGQNGFSFDGDESLNIGRAKYTLNENNFTDSYYANTLGDADQQKWVDNQATLIDADFQVVNNLNRNSVGKLVSAGDYWYGGYIAEVIAYASTVDSADRLIIKNYLAAKYGINIGAKDLYAHEGTHKHDVAGIGQADADNYHFAAQSARMLKISDASDLNDGEFMLFGHDSADISGWTTTETSGSSYQRLAREWRFDQTGGPVGTLTIEFDLSDAAALPADITQIVLMVDQDGDFSSDAAEYRLIDKGANIYKVENITIPDNYYVSIAGKKPSISFEASFVSGIESNTNASINLVLSENATTDVTIEYILVAGGTAQDGGVDFTFTDDVATIAAGTATTTIDFNIVDDTDSESNEYFYVKIQNPSNASLGAFSDLTYYIMDNDGLEWHGPAGIGNLSDQVNVWLHATEIGNISDRDQVADATNAWINQSENAGLDAFQSVSGQQPTFYSNTVQWNNRPLIDFQRANREFLEIADNSFMNTAPNSAPQTQRSILVVFRPSSDVTNRQVIFEEGGGTRGLNIYIESGKIHLGAWNDADDAGSGTAWNYLSSNSTIEGNQPYFALLEFDTPNLTPGDGEVRGTVNGTAFAPIAGAGTLYAHGADIGIGAMNNGACFEGAGGPGTEDCDGGEDYYFDGYIAEFISSNIIYNEAQKHILFNYLSAKYGIAITTTDYFEYDANNAFSYELFGVGQVDIDNSHITAQGSGIIKIENPQNLGDGEFLLIGHDTNLVDGWIRNNIPNSDSNIYRVERTWRVDETGDVGSLTFKLDTTLFDACPSETDYYCLIVDADGDFTSGSTIKLFQTKDADDLYEISGVDFNKGDYFTIGCIKPAIDFTLNSLESTETSDPSGFETINAEIQLNTALDYDVSVNYNFIDITASNTNDYDGTNGVFTLTAGNTSGTISFNINNDGLGEANETFEVELTNVTPNTVAIGYDATLTYTIIDDDETRKVNFGELTRSGSEDIGEDTAFVVLTQDAPGSGVSVDYEILSSSTATNGAIDYDLAQSGTLNFAAGEDSVLVIFDITDDAIDEQDENIQFKLLNPVGLVNLGDDTEFIYTIQDNDDLPDVQFTELTGSGMESFSPIYIEVSLSEASGQDVEVTFAIDGSSTALGNGIDYTLGYTTVTIPAGETTANISITIVNDKGQDDNETIILNMTGADFANVAGNTSYTYTIIDDDFGGWEGPGGIGNLDNQVGCWLRSTQVYNVTNGVDIGTSGSATVWLDQSNNGNDAYDRDAGSTYGAPVYYDDDATWNKRPVLWFKSSEKDILEIADNDEMNRPSGAQTKRTLIVVFRPADDISSRQVIFEEGGGWRGLNIYIEDDTLNIGGYNVGGAAGEVQWSYIPIRYELEENTPYFAILQFDFEDGSGDVRGALNGSDFQTLPGADLLYPHGDNIGIGGVNGGALGIGDANLNANSSYFNGYFAEFMSGNFVYNTAQLLILQNYLGAKYNIDLGAKDIFDYDAIHGWELLGIGQKAGDNSHNKAQGQGKILLSNPSDLNNDEFMLIGHDNGLPFDNTLISGIEQWIGNGFGLDIPNSDTNYVRVAQEWRVDMVGNVGSVNIDVDFREQGDNGQFDVKDPNFEKYVIMVDADGNFTDGATIYELKEDLVVGNEGYYVLENYSFNAGDYFTIGLANPAIGFVNATDEEMEDVGSDHSVDVSLNLVAASSITVDYKIETVDATAGVDYTDLTGTLTFAAGETLKTIDLEILNDVDPENDETFKVVLYNASGALLTQDTLVFTIHDDDNNNKVAFDVASATDTEAVGSYDVSVTRTETGGDSEVDYIISGGTATNGAGDDYILAEGTLSFTGVEASKNISITINEDAMDEVDETIIISLTNPSSCALGLVTEFTFTISDNDAEPTVQFTNTSGAGAESFNPVFVQVELSAESGKDVELYYEAVDGTALNGGIDYNVPTPASLTIPAGSTTGEIEVEVVNNLITTDNKDFTINLTSADNATVLGNSSYTYTILDDDDLGFEGPGGVGDETQYAFWYRANAESYSNGQTVDPFTDQSGNGNNATVGNGTPSFQTNVMGQTSTMPAVYFDGTELLEIPANVAEIDNASYTAKTIVVSFRTSGDVISRQVIYEQGGGRSGLSILINSNDIYFTAYNTTGGGWNMATVSNTILPDSNYVAILEFDKTDEGANGTLKGYLQGELIGTYSTISEPLVRSNNRYNGLGGMNEGMLIETGASQSGDGYYFTGYIAEVVHYNALLNDAQRVIVENYISSKYNSAVQSNRDNYKATHGYHIAGIGQFGSDDHIKARGTSMATLSEPAGMGSGDYMLIGDNNAGVDSWNAIAGLYDGTALFLDREWRISKTGTGLSEVQLGIDVSSPVPNKPADYPTYVIIIDPDNDNDGNPATQQGDLEVYPLESPEGNTLRIDAIALNDGDYIRVGVAKNRSQQSGSWHEKTTWLTGTVPLGESETAYISDGHTVIVEGVSNTKIGNIVVDPTGELLVHEKLSVYQDFNNTGSVNVLTGKSLYMYNDAEIDNSNTFTFETGSWLGLSSKTYTQDIEGLSYSNLYIVGGNYTISQNVTCDKIYQYSNAQIAAIGSPVIVIEEDWIINSTTSNFIPGNSTVKLIGSSNQRLYADFDLYNLEIDKSPGRSVYNKKDFIVNNNLILTNGILYAQNNITIGNNAEDAIQGGSNDAYVRVDGTGRLKREVAAGNTYAFPVGDNDEYSPVNVHLTSATLAADANISVSVDDSKHPNLGEGSYITRQWSIKPEGVTNPNYNVELFYTDADIVGTENHFMPVKYDDDGSNVQHGELGDIDVVANKLIWTGLTSFSTFTGADYGALPVELGEFKAYMAAEKVYLEWFTVSEINNDKFIIEKSLDGESFYAIDEVVGNGNSRERIDYSYIDNVPVIGVSYYRLRQIDFDGTEKLSKRVAIEYIPEAESSHAIGLYPNPSQTGNEINVLLSGYEPNEKIEVYVFSFMGSLVEINTELTNEVGSKEFKIGKDKILLPGVYIIHIKSHYGIENKRLIVE